MIMEATNTFKDGMNLDLPEIQLPNSAYSAALNATIITTDGNEMIIQNDMGNSKIKYKDDYVKLTYGFVPIGVQTYGEILYIVSYNPNTKQGEIGTFPSPDYKVTKSPSILKTYLPLNNFNNGKFTTEYLNFDLKHPVDIKILPSYDGSVNLILIDNKNIPRLINSKFAVREDNKLEIIEHIGGYNTNEYNCASQKEFDLITALLKQSYNLPYINFNGLINSGQLQVGGYVIYIKGSDEDGNLSDIIAESGVIPVFHGEDGIARSMNGGMGLERTDKAIQISIQNIDPIYTHIKVYYSKTTSTIDEEATTTCHEIIELKALKTASTNTKYLDFSITGFENTKDIDDTELNTQYTIIDTARTSELSQNILFLGNAKISLNQHYETLKNLSLTVSPSLGIEDFKDRTNPKDYTGKGYYDSKNIYNKVGYHNEELYRFGIVYIYSNGSKSTVFNVLGNTELTENVDTWPMKFDDEGFGLTYSNTRILKYNNRGVCKIKSNWDHTKIRYIKFNITDNFKKTLLELGIIGYFFVRLKRIPLLLCQAYTTPIVDNAFIPAIKYGAEIESEFKVSDYGLDLYQYEKLNKPTWKKASKHTFFVECFHNICGDNRQDWVLKDIRNNVPTIYLPTRTGRQSYEMNTSGTVHQNKDNLYKLTQDYYSRMLLLLDSGYLLARRVQTKFGNTSIKEDSDTNWINGNDARSQGYNIGKNSNMAFGLQPCGSLLLHGAYAGFCPEYELNLPYFNNLFTGQEFSIKVINLDLTLKTDNSGRVYYTDDVNYKSYSTLKAKIISVPDNVSLLSILRDKNDGLETREGKIENNSLIKDCLHPVNWTYRDSVYFSSKVGDATAKNIFKEPGSARMLLFSPIFRQDNFKITYDDNDLKDGYSIDKITEVNPAERWGFKGSDSTKYVCLTKNRTNINHHFVRGIFSPYLGIYLSDSELKKLGHSDNTRLELSQEGEICSGENGLDSSLINIYIPGYEENNNLKMLEYIKIRMDDGSLYYTISNPISVTNDKTINCYRGDCYSSVFTHRVNRNFLDSTNPSNDVVVTERGFLHITNDGEAESPDNIYDNDNDGIMALNQELFASTNLGDMNAIQLGSWVTFPCCTTMNIALRGEDRTYPTEKLQMGLYRSFYPLYGVNIGGGGKIPDSTAYNKGFSISGGVRTYTQLNTEIFTETYFKNRIYYSNVNSTTLFINGARTILSTNFRDYDNKYGSIVKLISLSETNGALLVIMEHGVGIVSINPRALINEGSSGTVFINTNNVLDDRLTILSELYGTTIETSIIKTSKAVYGIDTFAKKIWRTNGSSFEIISEGNITSFLNDYLDINNIEIGKSMLKSHYNEGKNDVIFTLYNYHSEHKSNNDLDNTNILWSICYNEILGKFITFYSWIPELSANIGNTYLTFEHQLLNNSIVYPLWKHGPTNFVTNTEDINTCNWFGKLHPFELEFIVNENPDNHKIFNNLKILSNNSEPESFHYTIIGDCFYNSLDKKNEYYRQERTKELFHLSGYNIQYDPNYRKINTELRKLWHYIKDYDYLNNAVKEYDDKFVKSNIPCIYYRKLDNVLDIASQYNLITKANRDYSYLSGLELLYDKRLQQYKLCNHTMGINIDSPGGVLRGNMKYLEDNWFVLINPIYYKEKNESKWENPPIVFNYDTIPENSNMTNLLKACNDLNLSKKDLDFTDWGDRKSCKLKDKYIKIRIRYSGNKKTIILGIKTLYNISYA